jgi:hypothetical protein
MEWNSIAIGQKYFQRANAIHPEEDPEAYSELLARQDLYYECYMSAFSREQFMGMLQKSINGDIKLPEETEGVDIERYRSAFALEASSVLKTLS